MLASSLHKSHLSRSQEHSLLSSLHSEVAELRRSVGGREKENRVPGEGEMSESLGLYLDLRGAIEQLQARIVGRGEGGGAAASAQRQGEGARRG